MVMAAGSVEWTVVNTEVEALQLEYNWIKEFDPRFNIRYRDDKSYPVLAVTLNEEYPRLMVYRGPRRKGVRYFGPYSHAWAIRETLDLLTRVFPGPHVFSGSLQAAQADRPAVPAGLHRQVLGAVHRPGLRRRAPQDRARLLRLPVGQDRPAGARHGTQMNEAAERLDFERAARLRDNISALKRALEKQTVVFGDGTDADVVAFADDELEAAVQVFHVRGGRVRGQRGWIVEKSGDPEDSGQAVIWSNSSSPSSTATRPSWTVRPTSRRTRCRVRSWSRSCRPTPRSWKPGCAAARVAGGAAGADARRQAGAGRDGQAQRAGCADAAQAQARRRLHREICCTAKHSGGTGAGGCTVAHRMRRHQPCPGHRCGGVARGVRGRSAAQVRLPPLRDQGGGGRRPLRRRGVHRRGDAPAVRAARLRSAEHQCAYRRKGNRAGSPTRRTSTWSTAAPRRSTRRRRFSTSSGVTDVAVIGLAKRLEEVWVPSEPDPVIMPRNSEGLYLLQRVRDEAHRFAITYHRSKRSKRMTASALDSVPRAGRAPAKGAGHPLRVGGQAEAGQRRGDHLGARHRRRDGEGGAGGARRSAPIRQRPPRLSAMIRAGHRDDGSGHGRGSAGAGRDPRHAARNRVSTSCWSPGCPGRAAAPRPRCSRTSAGMSPTTCRPS